MMSIAFLETAPLARRLRMRRIWTAIALVPAAFVVMAWIFLESMAGSRLQKAIAEADRTDPRWRHADVWASRAPVHDAGNSAVRVQMVLDRLPPRWFAEGAGDVPAARRLAELSGRLSQLDPLVRLSDQDGRWLHDDLDGLKPARSLALELARMPNGRYAIPSTYLFLNEPTDHSQKVRQVVRLLNLEAVDRIQQNDIDGALGACCAIVNAGRSFGDEPNLIPQLVRIAVDGVALFTMQRALAQGLASDRVLERVQQCLASEAEAPLLIFALTGDRATAFETFRRLSVGETKFSDWAYQVGQEAPANARGSDYLPAMFIRYNQAIVLESMNRAMAIARRPPSEQASLWAQFEVDRTSRNDGPARVFGILGELVAPAHGLAGLGFLRAKAILRVGNVMVAVERFQRAHGRWPGSIDTMVPRFLTGSSADPFTGRELVLKELPDGVVIYSLGSDQTDNGGKFDERGRDKPGYDLGYRLWIEDVRRHEAG
jgi:hypothetical protein